MSAITYSTRRIRVPTKHAIFVPPQFLAHFSTRKSSSNVSSGGDATFTISYLANSWGLPLKDAFAVSKKLSIKSRENSDAVLELLNKYEFTSAQISRLVKKWPRILQSSAHKTLSPKLDFFVSIGVPPDVLPQKLSEYPFPLGRSLENFFIPWCEYLKRIVESDKNVAAVFLRSPMAFTHGWPERVPSNIAILRERSVPGSSIASLLVKKPSMLILKKELFSAYVDRAVEAGFHKSRTGFVDALQVFGKMSETTLKLKMDTYRRCGWSESDLTAAFLRYPLCMKLSQKKIRANMDFLVGEVGLKAADVARRPRVLDFNVETRLRPRWIVSRVLKAKGVMKESTRITASLFQMSEANFLKKYIFDREEQIPQLFDTYRGKLSLSQIGLDENVTSNSKFQIEDAYDDYMQNLPTILARMRLLLYAPRKYGNFSASSFRKPQSDGADPTFIISYLTNSYGLSLKDAVSVSKKLRIKSRHSPDAVLDLFTKYGFTNAHISKLVTRWPLVLQSRARPRNHSAQTQILPLHRRSRRHLRAEALGLSHDIAAQSRKSLHPYL